MPVPRNTLVIMLKEPRPGRVKTRLARDIGAVAAAWWVRHQTSRLLRRMGGDRRWRTVIASSPATALKSRMWPQHFVRLDQGIGDLGDRMRSVFETVGQGNVVIIGGDIPSVTPSRIADAFRLFGRADIIFGPATDGGYWLVGVKNPGSTLPAGFMRRVRWSSASALDDTIASLGGRRSVALAATLADVDTAADITAGNDPSL